MQPAREYLAAKIADLDNIFVQGENRPDLKAKYEDFFTEAQRARNTAHGVLTATFAIEQLLDELVILGEPLRAEAAEQG